MKRGYPAFLVVVSMLLIEVFEIQIIEGCSPPDCGPNEKNCECNEGEPLENLCFGRIYYCSTGGQCKPEEHGCAPSEYRCKEMAYLLILYT